MSHPPTSEDRGVLFELVVRAQQGDHSAFEQLFTRTTPLVKRIAYSLLSAQDCDDAVQESFLLAYRKLPQLKAPEAFLGWLGRLTLHVCYAIKKKRPSELPLSEAVPAQASPEGVLDGLVLRTALGRLHTRDREVLILREMLGLSYEEVAVALRIPVGTVRSRLNGARQRLAERLNP